ncbi:MAG: hypothetical protein M0P58_05135 [Bacteroidales bacterium]|nr:hypothetical protein [Bacteroidales bacterium]
MKSKIAFGLLILVALNGCNKDINVPVPSTGPNNLMEETYPLSTASRALMDGVYSVSTGNDFLGDQVVVKSNRTHLLITTGSGIYFIIQTGYLDSVVFLQGYWRDGYSDETGLAAMYVSRSEGGSDIVTGVPTRQIIIRGGYGTNNETTDKGIVLQYLRPFSDKAQPGNFYILAHRSGGRTSDHLPVSENSLEMIRYTEKLGSTGIEIDVRLTSDGIPFIYHDSDINTRLTQKGPLAGPIENYSWLQLSTFVRLIHGEKIPTLEDALTLVVDSTLLRFVYLDMKANRDAMAQVIPIQQRILERARQKGRDLIVVVGIPTDEVLNDLMNYPDYQNIPSLCELSVDDVRLVNSRVWGPRWTLGTQNDLVDQMHSENRLAVAWTIDPVQWIRDFINEGHFDGLLSNYPYVVAYYYYIRE